MVFNALVTISRRLQVPRNISVCALLEHVSDTSGHAARRKSICTSCEDKLGIMYTSNYDIKRLKEVSTVSLAYEMDGPK